MLQKVRCFWIFYILIPITIGRYGIYMDKVIGRLLKNPIRARAKKSHVPYLFGNMA